MVVTAVDEAVTNNAVDGEVGGEVPCFTTTLALALTRTIVIAQEITILSSDRLQPSRDTAATTQVVGLLLITAEVTAIHHREEALHIHPIARMALKEAVTVLTTENLAVPMEVLALEQAEVMRQDTVVMAGMADTVAHLLTTMVVTITRMAGAGVDIELIVFLASSLQTDCCNSICYHFATIFIREIVFVICN